MSRNRCSTDCVCGTPLELGVHKASELMTPAQYAELSPSARRYQDCTTGYLFLRHECDICGAVLAVWFEQKMSGWVPYDTSYFHSFDDEPGREDQPGRGMVWDLYRELVEERRPMTVSRLIEWCSANPGRMVSLGGLQVVGEKLALQRTAPRKPEVLFMELHNALADFPKWVAGSRVTYGTELIVVTYVEGGHVVQEWIVMTANGSPILGERP